jgi:transposase
MWIEGVPCSEIQKILNVSATFISQFKIKFIKDGVKELKLKYQGSKAYLSREQRREIINYLDAEEYLSLQELREYIEDKYADSNQVKAIIHCLMKPRLAGRKLKIKIKKTTINW